MSVTLAAGTATEVAKLPLGWVVKRWGYAKNLPEHTEDLGKLVDSLMQLKLDVEREVERAKHQFNLPTNEVLGWIKDADHAIVKGSEYIEQYNRGGKGFVRMVRPSSYKLGKHMTRLSTAVKVLGEKGGSFSKFAVEVVPERVQKLPGGNIMGIEDNQGETSTSSSHLNSTQEQRSSVEQKLDEVWQCILDPNIMRIGIWGKGGIGKTTMIKSIINTKLQRTTQFNVVIFVVVSSDLNMRKLRLSIAKKLHLNLSGEEDNMEASHLLFSKLMGMKFFLILDDAWERIDLEVLGVPAPTNKNGCKVTLTTRKIAVCRLMETDKEIHLSDLPKNEAWELFSQKVGGVISSSIESTAKLVCEKCHGLPLALVVVGRALRRENDMCIWEHALSGLRSSQFELEGMEKDVFSTLKFSYDYLKNDTLRDCFLYCALFPGNYGIDIDSLIRYWVTEGLVNSNKGFAHALDKGRHDILKELVDCCLMEIHDELFIHMHDVIRDMAIRITSERGIRLLVNAGNNLDGCMEGNDSDKVVKINLTDNHLQALPDAPNIPRISTLLLGSNFKLEHIPDRFFTSMINLRVLDLSVTNINSLPQSIRWLVNLQALRLHRCQYITDITLIGSLRRLMLLDLSRSSIIELPDVIGELNCLCSLDLSHTSKLKKISPGTLSKLTKLEFLEMQGSAYFNGASTDGVMHDIGCLRHLHRLTLDVSSDYNGVYLIIPKLNKLASFYIQLDPVGFTFTWRDYYRDFGFSKQNRRCLELGNIPRSSDRIFELARYANKLIVRDMDTLDSVSSLGACNLKNLKELKVYGCESISKAIIGHEEQILLPHLEVLELVNNGKLPCVWEVKGVVGTFRNIKLLVMYNCIRATHVFSMSVISELGCLEQLKISNCDKMEQILKGADDQIKKIPKLEYLKLCWLESLNSLWEGQVFLPSLRRIKIRGCETLNCLPLSEEIAPALGCIEGYQKWWDDLVWTNEAARSHFQPLLKPSEIF